MKAVDDLTEFVRSHMLEPFDTKAHIETLVEHFENLTRAHEAVVRARLQLQMLDPLVADLDAYDGATAAIGRLATQQAALPIFFAGTLTRHVIRDPTERAVRTRPGRRPL